MNTNISDSNQEKLLHWEDVRLTGKDLQKPGLGLD